jgi:Flp pilus assembly protein TadD
MNSLTRKILICLLLMMVIAAGGWFGRKAYKKITERRLVAQARQYLAKQDWANTGLCLRRALQVNPMSAPASGMMADFLEQGGVAGALSWRIRAAQLEPGLPEPRLAWAKTAIAFHDPSSARDALDGLKQKDKTTVEYHKLEGALAWSLKNAEEAERHYTEAVRLAPTDQSAAMNLATIHLSSTNSAVAEAGRSALEAMTTNAQLRVPALRLLETEAISRKSYATALTYARKILESQGHEPLMSDRIDYLQIARAARSPDFESCLSDLKSGAATNATQAFAVGQWMVGAENPTNALRWLQSLPAPIQTNQMVPVLIANCLGDLNDWNALLAWVNPQNWNDLNFYRLALVSLSRSQLKQDGAAKAAWQKAEHLASQRLDRLSRLADFSRAWGWKAEWVHVLSKITTEFPNEKWAAGLLLAQYHRDGNTRDLAELLSKCCAANPTNQMLKNDLANVFLLRKTDLEKAHRMAREAYDSAPDNPYYVSTYAYSLLLQNKFDEAYKVVSGLKTNSLEIPSVAAYYGVVQARSGHKDLARDALQLASKGTLLPEEKEIVRLAQGQL